MTTLCHECGALLTDAEIENCVDGRCFDCCEEWHIDARVDCGIKDCPYSTCNGKEAA